MPLPPRRKRRAFGGKEGVWWRRKTSESITTCPDPAKGLQESNVNSSPPVQYTDKTTPSPPALSVANGTTATMEWDDSLARPVYHRSSSSCSNNAVSSSSDEHEYEHEDDNEHEGDSYTSTPPSNHSLPPVEPSTVPPVPAPPPQRGVLAAVAPPKPPAKRARTFGGRSRRPLSLILLEGDTTFGSSSPSTDSASSPSAVSSSPSPIQGGVCTALTSSNGAEEAPRKVLLLLTEEEGRREDLSIPRRVSTGLDMGAAAGGQEEASPILSPVSPPGSSTTPEAAAAGPNPFDFVKEDADHTKAMNPQQQHHPPRHPKVVSVSLTPHPRTPQRPTATSSLHHAKLYYAHLDASTKLQLDASKSPTLPRSAPSLIRTSRKIQLTSPGFVQEYGHYAAASRQSGVSPLTTLNYAKSRRNFFRKAELFDGFVDS